VSDFDLFPEPPPAPEKLHFSRLRLMARSPAHYKAAACTDDADAWLAKARAFAWPGRLDIFDDEQDDCAPPWETADALQKVRTYGEPTYRLVTVRLMGGEA
jgi:hypothetical protein